MMAEYTFTVKGTSPLLMHNPASMGRMTEGPKRKTIPTPQDEAEAGTYRNENGDLVFPAIGFRNALLKAASGYKAGKKALRGILAHIRPDTEFVTIFDGNGNPARNYLIDSRRAVVQKNGITRSRPRLDEWSAAFTLLVNEEITGPRIGDTLVKVLEEAGQTIGIGDYRPEKTGWYGCFMVVDYQRTAI